MVELAESEEGAGLSHPHPGDLQEGVGGGVINLMAVDLATARSMRRSPEAMLKKTKNTNCSNYSWFFWGHRVRRKHTPYTIYKVFYIYLLKILQMSWRHGLCKANL